MDRESDPRRAMPPPTVVAATLLVWLLPAIALWGVRSATTLSELPAIALAGLLSLVLFALGRCYWERRHSSGEVLFADLMIWGWARRRRIERRAAEARNLLGVTPGETSGPRTGPSPRTGPGDRTGPSPRPGPGHRTGPSARIDVGPDRRRALFRRLADELEASDPCTRGHFARVARYATMMAERMGLAPDEVTRIQAGALFHDVGKLYTPTAILRKPGPLSDDEYAVVKRHPGDGARLISLLLGDERLASIVLHHHERIDGTGYPGSLHGDRIPLGARIIAVADTFDSITSKRPYRAAMPHKAALDILRSESGSQLDPDAVNAFLSVYRDSRSMSPLAALSGAAEVMLPNLAASGTTLAGLAAGIAAIGATGAGRPLITGRVQQSRPSAVATGSGAAPRARTAAGPASQSGPLPNRDLRHRNRPASHRAGSQSSSPTGTRGSPPGGGIGTAGSGGGSSGAGGSGGGGSGGNGSGAGGSSGGGSGGGGNGGGGQDPVSISTSGNGANASANAAGISASVSTQTGGATPRGVSASVSTPAGGAGVSTGVGAAGVQAGLSVSTDGTSVNITLP